MQEYLEKEEQEILDNLAELDKKINITFDREAGKKLLEQKAEAAKRPDPLPQETCWNSRNNSRKCSTEEELKLMEKTVYRNFYERILVCDSSSIRIKNGSK